MRSLQLALALAGAAAAVRSAAADDVARADALFAEAVKLRDSNPSVACAKFNESLRLNPQAIGVLLNVAMCDEKQGRIASAVRRYRETRERAVEQRFPEYQKAADTRLAELEPEVPHLSIRLQDPARSQTKVVIDDRVIPVDALRDIPVDPGERVIVISAPGRISFERRLTIARRERREIEVPRLQKPSPRRTIGKITVAAGGGAVITGVVLGLVARSRYNDLANETRPDMDGNEVAVCTPTDNDGLICTDADVLGGLKSARQLGDIGTIVGGLGVAAMLVGGYLWYFAPKPYGERRGVARGVVVPQVGPDGAGIVVLGRF